jgi:hypothetical protein
MNNSITSNSAGDGAGGVYVNGESIIANNGINNNTAVGNGGGLILAYSDSAATNNTIAGNSASGDGGGLYLDHSSLTIANTIVAFNSSGLHAHDGTPTLLHNCVYANDGYDYSGIPDPTGTDGNVPLDPFFVQNPDPGPDGSWGTDDDDHGDLRLRPGSPCIDAGTNGALPPDSADLNTNGDTIERLPHDLDGNPRIAWCTVDIGAYEYQGPFGDFNDDCHVDLDDYELFEVCLWFSGPGVEPPFQECLEVFDYDADADVDLDDFAAFQMMFSR